MTVYPEKLTPHAAWHIQHNRLPQIGCRSFDDAITWYLSGGGEPVPGVQNGVTLSGIRGIVPGWKTRDQQGVQQDGVTFNGAVYEPMEVDLQVEAHGNTHEDTRKVIRDWIASWDVKYESELFMITDEMGYWWVPVRWFKKPTGPLFGGQHRRQQFLWMVRGDDPFWRTFDHTDEFGIKAVKIDEDFDHQHSALTPLGDNWKQTDREGDEDQKRHGYIRSTGLWATWVKNPQHQELDSDVVAINQTPTDTSLQHISMYQATPMSFGIIPNYGDPANDLWGRMNFDSDGNWGGDGIRARIQVHQIALHSFRDGEATWLQSVPQVIPPMPGDNWALRCGSFNDDRMYTVLRNGLPVLFFYELGALRAKSRVDDDHKGVGFGMKAGDWLGTKPARLSHFMARDQTNNLKRKGWFKLHNIGDQPAWPRYTIYGPGTFWIGNGPGEDAEKIKFGPIEDGQVVQLQTHPRRRSVVALKKDRDKDQTIKDILDNPGDALEQVIQNPFDVLTRTAGGLLNDLVLDVQDAIRDVIDIATNGKTPPLIKGVERMLQINPDPHNFYKMLDGRFTNPIPSKKPGSDSIKHKVYVKFEGGNENTRVVAQLTPKSRWPL